MMEPDNKFDIKLLRSFLKKRLQRDLTLHGYENEAKQISNLLQRTSEGESNSAILIGPRGSGKTILINSVLYKLLLDHDFYKNTTIVFLNGLLQIDDRLALKSITIQMKLENAVDGKVFGSFAENLQFLLDCMKSGDKQSKSIIFILEEFDLFCHHHNQTLLYNLFDISQSAQAPICVIGITCRLDVIELLEKRVKSRFSHRQIFISSGSSNFDDRLNLFQDLLKIPTENELKILKHSKINSKHLIENLNLKFLLNLFDPTEYSFSRKFIEIWNLHIKELAKNPKVKTCLKGIYDLDSTESYFKTFLYQIVSVLNQNHPQIKIEDIQNYYTSYQPELDNKVQLLGGLSVLEICLVIAMKHHSEIYDRDPFNFEIIFKRFTKFSKVNTTMQGVERSVALKAYEHLKNLEFIIPVTNISRTIQKEFQMHKMTLTYNQINQCITKYQALPTEVFQWAQSSLF